MGNAVSGPAVRVQAGALDGYVSELGPDIVYGQSIGQPRFLKTVRAIHNNGPLLIKVFIKPSSELSLRTYHRRLNNQRDQLADVPNVYTYQVFLETEKAGYIIRQWLAHSLFDRISTRPFLSLIEKKWIAFQILTGLFDARKKKISHGSLSTLNILITSSNWVYITDFASSLKPTNLPLNDPDDFYYFFDASGRGVCNIAPERFYEGGSETERLRQDLEGDLWSKDGQITEAMDVFSAGCVIAELFVEGGGTFRLADLFKYRECGGDIKKLPELDAKLKGIKDQSIKTMVIQMIDLNPTLRPNFETLLNSARGSAFPESFYSFYHGYVHSVEELPSPSPFSATAHFTNTASNGAGRVSQISMVPSSAGGLLSAGGTGANTPTTATPSVFSAASHTTTFSHTTSGTGVTATTTTAVQDAKGRTAEEQRRVPNDADRRIDTIWNDFERVVQYLNEEINDTTNAPTVAPTTSGLGQPTTVLHDVLPVQIDIPNISSTLPGVRDRNMKAAERDGTALIILSLVSSNIRSCLLPSSKLKALDLLLFLSCYLTDEAKLDRLIPYVIDLLHDDAAIVRAAAIRAILQVLSLVSAITPANASIIPEYILLNSKHLTVDPDVMVRCIYAQCLVPLTDIGAIYLEMAQALKAHGPKRGTAVDVQEESYDSALSELQSLVQEQLTTLLVDKASVVKRAMLHNTSSLCIFLGRQKANDVLLSHMLTYLNDRDWMLRYAFFQSIVDVAVCGGGKSLDEYILPLMIQALSDTEETVVAKVIQALTELCDLGLFQKMRIWELMSAVLGFLYHPNVWIRQASAAFLASASRHLPTTDVWCILYPSLKYFLRSDVRELNEETLLTYVKPPVSRLIFDAVIAWAKTTEKTQFWKSSPSRTRTTTRTEAVKESLSNLRRSVNLSLRNSAAKSDEDEQQIQKLHQMGMTSAEEAKLMAMRDYITKLVDPRASRFSNRAEPKMEVELLLTGMDTINLQKLGVMIHTVFLGNSTITRRPDRRSTITSLSSPRILSVDKKANPPLDDLRKKLLTMDSSTTSLHSLMASPLRDRERRESTNSTYGPTPGLHLSPMHDKSPPESVVSGGDVTPSAFARRRQRIQLDGKAPPLVSSIRTNVSGHLEAPSTLRPVQEDSVAPSGRSSPVSHGVAMRRESTDRQNITLLPNTDGGDAAMATILDHMNVDLGREAMMDFGPRVKDVPIRRRTNVRTPLHTRDLGNRKADITLIANLTAHTGPVNGLVVSPDHAFFVSCSDDKTVKVWDTAKLERNVTRKPRHVYTQHHAPVTAICMLENSHCFASADSDGGLHVVRVYVTYNTSGVPKYSKILPVREHRVDHAGESITCMVHYNTENASNLIYGTTYGNIVVLDLRTMRVLQHFQNPVDAGAITSMCLDKKRTWIVTGNLTGTLALWDIRFGLSLRTWKVGSALYPGMTARVHQCATHPVNRQWIIVASETQSNAQTEGGSVLVEVWDLEKTQVVETFVTRDVSVPSHGQGATLVTSYPPQKTGSVPPTPADAIAMMLQARNAQAEAGTRSPNSAFPTREAPCNVRALAVGLDFGGQGSGTVMKEGFVLTGGLSMEKRNRELGYIVMGSEDRKLRLWHLGLVDRSIVVSGVDVDSQPPSYSTIRSNVDTAPTHTEIWQHYDAKDKERRRGVGRPSLIGNYQQGVLRSHQDTITAIICIDSPFRGGIVSGDHSGMIKVYRVLEGDS